MKSAHSRLAMHVLLVLGCVTLSCAPDGAPEGSPEEAVAEGRPLTPPRELQGPAGITFLLIPAGGVGRPEHFYLSQTEVTNAQYRQFRSDHRQRRMPFAGADCPVSEVTYDDALGFAAWLNERDASREYRLPSEEEREWACAASADRSSWYGAGDDALVRYANVNDRAHGKVVGSIGEFVDADDGRAYVAPVGFYDPNPYGLYDMVGNVWEWTATPGENPRFYLCSAARRPDAGHTTSRGWGDQFRVRISRLSQGPATEQATRNPM